MNSPPFPADKPDVPLKDALVQLELRIARRADELSRLHGRDQTTDRERWTQAERDVLGHEADLTDR